MILCTFLAPLRREQVGEGTPVDDMQEEEAQVGADEYDIRFGGRFMGRRSRRAR